MQFGIRYKMTYISRVMLVLVFVNVVLYNSASAADAESRQLIREIDLRVCRNEPSCDLTNSVQKDRLTLKKRNCMCDFECSEYDDCCTDSQYFNAVLSERKSYFCHPYSQAYMVVSCASDYRNQSVIANCEKGMYELEENDYDLVIPVTNVEKRITYANKYCATCNNDRKYKTWDFYAGCGEPVGEDRSISVPSQTSTSRPGSTQKSYPVYARPDQDIGRRYESNAKGSSKDFIGGCNTENSPCRSEYKPEVKFMHQTVPQIPAYDYQKTSSRYTPVGKAVTQQFSPKYVWNGNSPNAGALNIRIEIGGRFKRQDSKKINYAKYANQIDDLIKKARYDARSKKFVVTSNEGKTLICRFNSTYPKTLEDAVRTCVPNVVSDCGSSGSSCPSYTSIAYEKTTKTAYRNRECARCNGISDDKLIGCLDGSTRSAASKDLAKTAKNSQDSDLGKLSQSDNVGF